MNSNDARIAAVYTAAPGGVTEDKSPNAGPPKSTTFDVIVQLEAGNVLGQSGANYTLTLTAINDDTGAAVPALTQGPFAEQFQAPEWEPSGGDFVRTSTGSPTGILRYSVTIPAGLTGQFHYNVKFVSAGYQVVEIATSNPFILV
jgi:hypothetical protein